jgi:hypothetical protein
VRWPWQRRANGSAEIRRRAEAQRDATKQDRPFVAKRAPELAHLTDSEFAARVVRAFHRTDKHGRPA